MFPPTKWQDIDDYDHAEVIAGYRSWARDDPRPGPNHSDGFRWGWQNGFRDHAHEDDGFDSLRHAFIRDSGRWRRTPTGIAMVVPS